MKKVCKVILFFIMIVLSLTYSCLAVNEAELEQYFMEDHEVAGTYVHLTEPNKLRVKRYLQENDVTDEQATFIVEKCEELRRYMTGIGVYEVMQLNHSQRAKALAIANEGLAVIGLHGTYNSNDKAVDIYENGKLIESVSTLPTKLVQTGNNNYIYYISFIAIVMLSIIFVVFKRIRNNGK